MTTYNLKLTIQDDDGRVKSFLNFLSDTDFEVAKTTKSGGLEQVAQALLTAAVSKSATLGVLELMSRDSNCLRRDGLEAEVTAAIEASLYRTLQKIAPEIVRGTIFQIRKLNSECK